MFFLKKPNYVQNHESVIKIICPLKTWFHEENKPTFNYQQEYQESNMFEETWIQINIIYNSYI